MKTLMLSADDIQNFSKLIYDTKTAAHLANVAATQAVNLNTTTNNNSNGKSNNTLTSNTAAPIINSNNNNNSSNHKNLMALQYYLKQTGNYMPTAATTTTGMTLPQLHAQQQQQQQQLQNVIAATTAAGTTTTSATAAAASALVQYQQQLQQQQTQQSHHHHQQQQQLLAQSQTQLKHLQLKQPTIHQQHTSNYHHHPYYQQQTHHQQQQQQQHAHHHLQQQLQLHQKHQQQQLHQQQHINASSHLHQQQQHQLLNIPNAATTATTALTHKKATANSTPNVPVHALNQNSNFSAASSSTGGGTISSHAPTQQSNGSSLSPPARHPQHQPQQQHHITNAATTNSHLNVHVKTPAASTTMTKNASTAATTTASAAAAAVAAAKLSSTLQRGSAAVTGTTATSNTQCGKKIKTEPLLSQHHQSERLTFAKSHIVWNEDHWKRVIFQDERKFNLDGPDGFSYYFHDLRNYERTLSQRPRGNSVYVYLIISSNGPIHLEVSSSKLKLETCIETIVRERTNIIAKLGGNTDFLVQDHNWSTNASVATQEWLNAEHLKIQKWPTIAHDLNIMENIWGWLIREVYDGGRKFSRKDDLIFRIKEAWSRLPMDLVTNLYSTLPERITELYYTRGVYTNC